MTLIVCFIEYITFEVKANEKTHFSEIWSKSALFT